jgi:hypothetical protein
MRICFVVSYSWTVSLIASLADFLMSLPGKIKIMKREHIFVNEN